ncbi:hypothetical protein HDU91_002469, partial [Kappamyces sp. JEL0680]
MTHDKTWTIEWSRQPVSTVLDCQASSGPALDRLVTARVPLSVVDTMAMKFPFGGQFNFYGPCSVARLQETLVQCLLQHFPMLLGTLEEDNGRWVVHYSRSTLAIEWIEGCAKGSVLDIQMDSRDAVEMRPDPFPSPTRTLTAVQVTLFDDGVALGFRFPHGLLDAQGATIFVDTWTSLYRGQAPAIVPVFNPSLLDQDKREPAECHDGDYVVLEPKAASAAPAEFATKIFYFSQADLRKLKESAMADLQKDMDRGALASDTFVSTNDCLSAQFATLVTKARQMDRLPDGPAAFKFMTIVNGRKRLQPNLPDGFCGNVLFPSVTHHQEESLGRRALRIRSGIARYQDGFVRDTIRWIASQPQPHQLGFHLNNSLGPDIQLTSWADL